MNLSPEVLERVPFGHSPKPPKTNTDRLREFLAKLAMTRDVRYNPVFAFPWEPHKETKQ